MADRIKVLIADDHPIVRHGLGRLISAQDNLELVGEASDGFEAVSLAGKLRPDVIVMDLNMPNCGGLEAILLLQKDNLPAKVLVLTISEKEDDLITAIKAGAKGYVLKETGVEGLTNAIVAVASGEAVITPHLAAILMGELKQRVAKSDTQDVLLTKREMEILQLLGAGATNKEIADQLFISAHTVKIHVSNTLEKLHMRNRTEVTAYAAKMGWLKQRPDQT